MTTPTPVPIGSLVESVESWNPGRQAPETTLTYIDLGSVDQNTKKIRETRQVLGIDAPSRARQLVAAGDVLVSTVRPNLNGVARVPHELDLATASTGFCVLRPERSKLDGAYLFHWVRSPQFVCEMARRATGASYPAVSDRIIFDSCLPLFSLQEQRRIAKVLDVSDALGGTRRAALARLDELTQAIFLDMFGDPVANPREWPIRKLSDIGTLDRGTSKHRPRNAPELLGGPYPFIQTGDVANSGGYIRRYGATYSEAGFRQSKLWPAGTLCITIAANIAQSGILTFDACFPDSVVGFRSDESATVEYVRCWLSFIQGALEERAPESAQKNINLEILRGLGVPVPPLQQRRIFAGRVNAVEALRTAQHKSASALDALFASLQHRAFRGEL